MKNLIRNFLYKIIVLTHLDILIGFLGRRGYLMSLVERLSPPVTFYKKGDVRKIKINQIRFEIQMHDLMSQPVYFGLYMNEILCLKKHFPPDAIVIDVGANIGRWSLFVSYLFKTKKIFSFEPFYNTFLNLKKNISLNNFLDIEIYNLALNNKNEQVYINSVNESNSGLNFISTQVQNHENRIEAVTLDSFLQRKDIQKVDVIKIDVEGFEMNILEGAIETLKKDHPVLICEIDDSLLAKNNTTPLQIFELLEKNHYKIIKLPLMETLSTNSNLKNVHFDILALPQKRSLL